MVPGYDCYSYLQLSGAQCLYLFPQILHAPVAEKLSKPLFLDSFVPGICETALFHLILALL